jgi:tetratricopeptide (TPR) repeat protein
MSKRRRSAQAASPKARDAAAELQPPRDYRWWAAITLVVINVAVYWSVRSFEFVRFDDMDYVAKNSHVRAGITWAGLKWALTTGHIANWHPVTWLSHMLDVQLFGVNAGPHHLTNLFFHIVNTLLLFLVLQRTTGATARSAFVAALFAAHPLHVESVAWISERKDVLSTFLLMLALLSYIEFVLQKRTRYYAAVVLCFALGLMTKPMLVTLPFVLLLLDIWPLRRIELWRDGRHPIDEADRSTGRRLILEKLPLLALAIASSVVTVVVQRRWGAVGSSTVYPLALRLENATVNYVAYLGKALWPAHLSGFYPYRQSVTVWEAIGAGLLLIGITIGVLRGSKQRPYLLVGWFWFLGTLIPVIGLIQAGLQSIGDRYTYIPLIGLFIVVAWGAQEIGERLGQQRVVLVAAALIVVACGVRSRAQAETWKNSLTFWQHSIDVTPNNAFGTHNLGVVLIEADRRDEGIAMLREAKRIDPTSADVRIDLANALNQSGAAEEAIAEFATVIQFRPDYAEGRVAYASLLRIHKRNAEAIAQLQEAVRLDSTLATAHNELGNVFTSEGRSDDALAEYQRAVRLDPSFADARNNVGAAYTRVGKFDAALTEFLEALRVKPDNAMFHYNAAMTLDRLGRTNEAVDHLRSALRADPSLDAARQALNRLAPGSSGG